MKFHRLRVVLSQIRTSLSLGSSSHPGIYFPAHSQVEQNRSSVLGTSSQFS
jgi:hypothetical protein